MNISRSKISLIYMIVIIILIALVSVSSFMASSNTQRQLNGVIAESVPLTNLAQDILIDLINMETGIRGYEITADDKYLEPYDTGTAGLKQHLDGMAVYQKKYPRLRSVMEGDAIPQITRLQTYYENQLALIRGGQKNEALRIVSTGIGRAQMDRFRQIHTKIKAEIETIATDAYDSARTAERMARVIITIGGGVAIIVGLLSAVIFNRANRAEVALRKSEETYRYMAESLEVQNEEITAQQEEQVVTLEKLSHREQELEAINSYQEKLTGSTEMNVFLEASVPALLQSLQLDAAMVVMRSEAAETGQSTYEIVYSCGYPAALPASKQSELFGPAHRVMTEKKPIESARSVTGEERGFHQGIAYALDRYFPLLDNAGDVIGFLMLTGYLTSQNEQKDRLSKGLAQQFSLAFQAQQNNEEKRRQAERLERLNDQLLQEKAFIEEQRDLIENILESTHEGMMMTDAEGRLLFANPRVRMSHRIGERITDIYKDVVEHTPSLISVYHSIQSLLNGDLDSLNERFHTTNSETGQLQHVELYATKVGDKKKKKQDVHGYLFVLRDRTDEEKADEMKNEFISIVSHELRTPLSSVLGFIEILLHRDLKPDKQQRYLQTIYKEAMRLSTLINDFLDLQRMESGKQLYHFSPVELTALVHEVAEQWHDKQSHWIELLLPKQELWVRGDADRLKQVVHNLLSNAIKYSPQAERVELSLEQEDNTIHFKVKDFGLGIPDEAKDKLFSKFYRVDNSDRRQIGGTGLGLSIVREIVEAHHGTISFESKMGEGTTFTVLLTAYQLNSAEGSIMILEDDDNLAKLIQVALAKLQIPTIHLASAEEALIALKNIKEQGPKLCIVDILLEGSKNGWDFIAELYRHPKFYRTPVIVSTALEPPQDYHENDMEKFLRKPFSMEKLLQVADQLLNHTHRQPSYIFPAQDEEIITMSLAKNGIEVREITRKLDHIEIEPMTNRSESDDDSSI